jgi:chromosome segregation ATPase
LLKHRDRSNEENANLKTEIEKLQHRVDLYKNDVEQLQRLRDVARNDAVRAAETAEKFSSELRTKTCDLATARQENLAAGEDLERVRQELAAQAATSAEREKTQLGVVVSVLTHCAKELSDAFNHAFVFTLSEGTLGAAPMVDDTTGATADPGADAESSVEALSDAETLPIERAAIVEPPAGESPSDTDSSSEGVQVAAPKAASIAAPTNA